MLHRCRCKNSGLWVAVLGPDGAGKSAAIQWLTQETSLDRGVERFHFRFMFSRRWQDSPPVTDPHGKRPRALFLSIFKLLFWLADYSWGYVAVICPAVRRSTLVLFDRYYIDLLVDPKRYRLPDSAHRFAKFLALLVPAPDLYILLDVPAEVLQHRKAEVTLDEARRQRVAYLQMFRSMPNAFILDAAGPLDEVTRQMKFLILHTRAMHAQRATGVSLIAGA